MSRENSQHQVNPLPEKTLYILDTNILLHEPFAFLSFQEHDSIKDRRKDVSRDARVAIRALEDVLKDATPEEILAGVPLSGMVSNNLVGDFLFLITIVYSKQHRHYLLMKMKMIIVSLMQPYIFNSKNHQ